MTSRAGEGSVESTTGSKALTIICTARNAALTIGNTIDSILAQDLHNWKMIIVDDGSTDETVSICRRFAQAEPRIRIIATEGMGRGRALNRALAEAEGELIANIDADDESHPERLRRQVEAIAHHPRYGVLCTGHILISGYGPAQWPDRLRSEPLQVVDITSKLMFENPVIHSSVLMRRSLLREVGGYSETRRTQLDYDLWVRLAEKGSALGKIEIPLTAKRIHQAQSFENRKRINYMLSSVEVQMRAIRSGGGGVVPLMSIPLRVGWNLLPAAFREYVKGLRFG